MPVILVITDATFWWRNSDQLIGPTQEQRIRQI